MISQPTLEGFRDAGFLFDHAIRCPLSKEIVKKERQLAVRYESRRVQNPSHLRQMIAGAPIVWVMGHIASNAVANLSDEFSKERRSISQPPYPKELLPGSKFFLSAYFHRFNEGQTSKICGALASFARAIGLFA